METVYRYTIKREVSSWSAKRGIPMSLAQTTQGVLNERSNVYGKG